MASWRIVENVILEWSKNDHNLKMYVVGEKPENL